MNNYLTDSMEQDNLRAIINIILLIKKLTFIVEL